MFPVVPEIPSYWIRNKLVMVVPQHVCRTLAGTICQWRAYQAAAFSCFMLLLFRFWGSIRLTQPIGSPVHCPRAVHRRFLRLSWTLIFESIWSSFSGQPRVKSLSQELKFGRPRAAKLWIVAGTWQRAYGIASKHPLRHQQKGPRKGPNGPFQIVVYWKH